MVDLLFLIEDLSLPCNRDLEHEKEFNKAHHFQITNVYAGFKDSYTFASYPENEIINQLCLSNLTCLEAFINYFLVHTTSIIQKAEKEKFYFPKLEGKNLEINRQKEDNYELLQDEFYKALRLKKLPIRFNEKVIYLNKREVECLRSIILGKTSKLISKELDISYRTVETHLNNIKKRLECWSKNELIELVLCDEVIKNYIMNNQLTGSK